MFYFKYSLLQVNETTEKVWISPSSSYYLSSLIQKKKRHQEVTVLQFFNVLIHPFSLI